MISSGFFEILKIYLSILRIKSFSQKSNLEALLNFKLNLFFKKNLDSLLNFELNLIHKNKLRSFIELRIKPYS